MPNSEVSAMSHGGCTHHFSETVCLAPCSVRGLLWVGGITNDVVMPPTQRWPHSEPFFLPAAAKKHLRRCKSMEMRRSCGQGRSLGAPRGPSASYSHRSTTSYHEVVTTTTPWPHRLTRGPADNHEVRRFSLLFQPLKRYSKCQDLRKWPSSGYGQVRW